MNGFLEGNLAVIGLIVFAVLASVIGLAVCFIMKVLVEVASV